jgi:hypothetical protein
VSVGAFCLIGTTLALLLCGAARGSKSPVPTRADLTAEEHAPAAQAR